MTGTAATEVSEFDAIYKLPVAVVPTNRPITRTDNPDVVFRLEKYKWKAAVTEIKRMHKTGRPVLVGTTSVERSEMLSAMLVEEGIRHQARRGGGRRVLFRGGGRGAALRQSEAQSAPSLPAPSSSPLSLPALHVPPSPSAPQTQALTLKPYKPPPKP